MFHFTETKIATWFLQDNCSGYTYILPASLPSLSPLPSSPHPPLFEEEDSVCKAGFVSFRILILNFQFIKPPRLLDKLGQAFRHSGEQKCKARGTWERFGGGIWHNESTAAGFWFYMKGIPPSTSLRNIVSHDASLPLLSSALPFA